MREALLIVDFQNDFTPPDGALAVPEGDEIVGLLNDETADDRYEVVIATRDWHPPEHSSFEEQGGKWPPHCISETEGAELHPELSEAELDYVVDKGQSDETEGYSAFESDRLWELLSRHEVERVRIGGLATDYCVRHTALDALEAGLEVELLVDATRGVDADDSREAIEEIERAGGSLVRAGDG